MKVEIDVTAEELTEVLNAIVGAARKAADRFQVGRPPGLEPPLRWAYAKLTHARDYILRVEEQELLHIKPIG